MARWSGWCAVVVVALDINITVCVNIALGINTTVGVGIALDINKTVVE